MSRTEELLDTMIGMTTDTTVEEIKLRRIAEDCYKSEKPIPDCLNWRIYKLLIQ